ncbi:MAG TPA: asparagine synthase B [Bacteroidales bacterium]|nr:asparagine synthase B [Bacteroidales bacterium]
MCGILAVIGKRDPQEVQRLSKRMSHRGPDESGVHVSPWGAVLCHERLSIIDLSTGRQPIQGTGNAYVMHNGEIYNHMDLRKGELSHHTYRTTCDSEVIVHLYEEYGHDFCNKMRGIFSFVIVDDDKKTFMVARDPIGVKPFYWGTDAEGNKYFSSEMKSIADQCIDFEAFPPGHYYSPETGLVKYYKPVWADYKSAAAPVDYNVLRDALVDATKVRLMSDVPLAVLLSGGLDSSLISSITKRLLRGTNQELHSFSVGLSPDAPDLKAAREVAKYIGTIHHEVYFSVEEGIKELEKIIWHLESYDVTTIRASTPMYFLSKYISDMGIKVVLSGEGADEVFGGYLYFHNSPSAEDFTKETIRRVGLLSTADCLRADKATMAFGLEARVPFLDRKFLDVAMTIRPEDRMPKRSEGRMEKYIVRKAFDDKQDPYLPESILWRQKEQFSDGVGYNWIDQIIQYCNKQVSDAEFATAAERFPHNTPATKEAFYFRTIFEKHYPQQTSAKTVLKWVPKWQKNEDPSGRVCDNHEKKIDDVQALNKV